MERQGKLALVWSYLHDDGRDVTGAAPPRAAWTQAEDPTAIRDEPPSHPEVVAPEAPTDDGRGTVIHVNFRTKQRWHDEDV